MSLKEINIGSLGQIITGNTPPKKDKKNYGGIYPFIKPTDMTIGKRFVDEWDETYSEKAFEKYKKALIPPGATGVVTIGTVGEKIFQSNQECFTNQSVNVVIPNEDYDENYVFYVLKLNLNKVLSANPGTSSGRHHVSKSNFSSIKINVVKSKRAQQKIASILGVYDDLIENNLKRIQLLEETAQNLYKEWFVNFKFPNHETHPFDEETGLPEGWEKRKIEEIIKIIKGKKPKNEYQKFKVDRVLYLLIDVLERKVLRFTDNEKVRLTEEGETFMIMDGSRSGKVLKSLKGAIGSTLAVLRIVDNLITKEYCFCFFQYRENEIISKNTGSAIPHANKSYIYNMGMSIPDSKTLNSFTKVVKNIFSQIEKLHLEIFQLQEARDLLLPRLMNQDLKI